MFLKIEELSLLKVGDNEYAIRRQYHDELGRRCTQFVAHIACTTADNEALAREFLDGIEALQTRVAEQRDAPVHAEQKCPTCDGLGMRKYGDERGLWHCYDCNGTGISNRSAGG